MKGPIQFLWRTMLGGVFFLVPLLLLLVLLRECVQLLARVLNPAVKILPFKSTMGIATEDILALLVLIFITLIVGLIAQISLAKRLNATLEQLVLSKIPGYTFFKTIARDSAGIDSPDDKLTVALANIDEAWLLAFIVEESAGEFLTVFIPSAPTPTAGSIYYLRENQIKRLNVPVSAAIKCVMQLGVGSQKLLSEAKTTNPAV